MVLHIYILIQVINKNMGYNLEYIYKDIDDSYKNFFEEKDNENMYYTEKTFEQVDIIITKVNQIIEISTMERYNLYDKAKIKLFELKLNSLTKSKIYRISEYLMDKWNGVVNVEYWEDDEKLIADFFEWLSSQDKTLWSVL